MKNTFEEKFPVTLKPQMFHIDCEFAAIKSLIKIFPETPVTLCSVHILRNLMKHLKEYTSGDFYKNPTLLKFWRIIPGSFFFNLDNPPILSEILKYLKSDLRVSRFLNFLQLLCHKNAPNQLFMF